MELEEPMLQRNAIKTLARDLQKRFAEPCLNRPCRRVDVLDAEKCVAAGIGLDGQGDPTGAIETQVAFRLGLADGESTFQLVCGNAGTFDSMTYPYEPGRPGLWG